MTFLAVLLALCTACLPNSDVSEPPGFVKIEAETYTRALGDSKLSLGNVNGDGDEYGDQVEEWVAAHEATVTVPYDFYMSRRHVTNAQFARFVEETGYVTTVERDESGYMVNPEGVWTQGQTNDWRDQPWEYAPNKPVVQISWFDAMAYAGWKSEQVGMEVRLPTLEEWELAARDDLGPGAWPWGDDFEERANCADRRFRPYVWRHGEIADGRRYVNIAREYPATDRGLRDAVGNVWSWVYTTAADREASSGTYSAQVEYPDPQPETEMAMVGGAFASRVAHCNLLAPMTHPARDGSFDVGFRLVALP